MNNMNMYNSVLLVSERTLKERTLINDNVDGLYILPAIQLCQDVDLQTVIGPVLVKKLQSLVSDGTIDGPENKDYKDLLDNYVTPYMCWQTMTAIQVNINFKLSNSGVIQNQDDKKYNIDYRSGKELIAQYEKYSNAYAMKLKNFLCANVNKFPEYRKCENFEGEEDPMLCSIFLSGASNRYSYIGK